MNTTLILQNVYFLRGALNPDWFDGHPGQPGPPFGPAISDYIVGELLRDISVNLHNQEIANTLYNIGKDLVSASSDRFVAGWEEGDQLCYLFPRWPFPRFRDNPIPVGQGVPVPGPRPEPWLEHITPAMNDIVLAHALRELASLTSSEKASSAIKQAGETIVRTASSKLFDEYCGTSVKLYVPHPRPKATAA
jgi:hypothetical protein